MQTSKRILNATFSIAPLVIILFLIAIPYYAYPKYLAITILFAFGFCHAMYSYMMDDQKYFTICLSALLYLLFALIPIAASVKFIIFDTNIFNKVRGWGVGYESVPYPYHIYHLFAISLISLWGTFLFKTVMAHKQNHIKYIKHMKTTAFFYSFHCLFFSMTQLIFALRYNAYYNSQGDRGFWGSHEPVHNYNFLFEWQFWILILAPWIIISISTIGMAIAKKRRSVTAT